MIILKLLISYAIPDVPSWVATEMAKIEFHRREIEKAASYSFFQPNQGLSLFEKQDKEAQV